jgi:hypothetical protein
LEHIKESLYKNSKKQQKDGLNLNYDGLKLNYFSEDKKLKIESGFSK